MQQSRALLTAAVSTIDLRILALEPGALPRDERIEYRFVVQRVTDPGQQERVRAHVATLVDEATAPHVTFSARIGLAASRNEALAQSDADYIHFCDDDLILKHDGLAGALEYLERERRVDAVWCRSVAPDGRSRRKYPAHETELSVLNSGGVGTPELVFRMASIRRLKLAFDERFGAGSQFLQGEEYIFLADLLRAGGRAVHLDRVLFEHELESTGSRNAGPAGLAARAAVLERVFGRLALPYKLAYAARHRGLYGSFDDLKSFLSPQLGVNRER